MNSIQRVLAALTFGRSSHGKPDRVPVLPVPLMQGALVYGCSVQEYFAMSAEQIAHAQIELNRIFGGVPDGVAGIPHVIEDITAFGAPLQHYFANSTPAAAAMVIRDYDEILSLKCPSPESSPQLRKTTDTIASLARQIGSEKVVIGACIAPFSLPSMLMGTAKWMRLLFTPTLRQRYLQRIMSTCVEFVTRWANQQLKAGAHVVVLADGMASATMVPRSVFEELVVPMTRKTIQAIHGMVAYELVGRAEPFVDACVDLGAVALMIGEEDDIANCKQKLRGRLGLIGNVNNMKMRRWSSARVALHAKRALTQGMDGYGFVLANQGPEIPFDVSVDNVQALVQTVVKYGHYPTDPPLVKPLVRKSREQELVKK